jgi:hypothetical protein
MVRRLQAQRVSALETRRLEFHEWVSVAWELARPPSQCGEAA